MRMGRFVLLCIYLAPISTYPRTMHPRARLPSFQFIFFLEASNCFLKKPDPKLRQKLGLPEEKPHSLPLCPSLPPL